MSNTKKFADRVHGGPTKATRPVGKLPTSPGPAHKSAHQTLVDTPHPNAHPTAHTKTGHNTAIVGVPTALSQADPNQQPSGPSNPR